MFKLFKKNPIKKRSVPRPKMVANEIGIDAAEKFARTIGVVSTSSLQREFYLSYGEAAKIIDELEERGIIEEYSGTPERKVLIDCGSDKLSVIDKMEGHEFEFWCASLLRKNGFINVNVTPGSGDHGVDVLAEKDGVFYAIQCKCYSRDLDNTPVQEVFAGKEMYNCQVGAVMTNRGFTEGAKMLAEKTRILLWDRNKLLQMMG